MSMRIPDEFIDVLRQKIDVIDVISEHVRLKRSGRSYMGLCPFHSERTPSFHVTPSKGMYYCFGCGAGGTAITFLMEVEQISFAEAVEKLAAKAGLPLPASLSDGADEAERSRRAALLHAVALAVKFYNHILMNHSAGAQALAYLLGRGLTKKTSVEFELGYAPRASGLLTDFLRRRKVADEVAVEAGLCLTTDGGALVDRFRGRVMFPIFDGQGRPVGFGGRTLGDDQPKYLNSPETSLFRKGRLLYGYDRARQAIRRSGRVLLLEGYVDVIALHQHGIQNAVGGLGTALTPDQAGLLHRVAEEIILAYDGDTAGRHAASRAVQTLREAGADARVAALPAGVDPDEWVRERGAAAFRAEVLDQAQSGALFELQTLTQKHPEHLTSGRIAYLKDATAVLAAERSALEREAALEYLVRTYGVSQAALREELERQMRARQAEQADRNKNWKHTVERTGERAPLPADPSTLRIDHETAERQLLTYMLIDVEVAKQVERELPQEFSIPVHSALQAYLYMFYEDHDTADPSLFLSMLDDAKVVQFAAGLLHAAGGLAEDLQTGAASRTAVRDCIQCLRARAIDRRLEQVAARMKEAFERGDADASRQLQSEFRDLQRERSSVRVPQAAGAR